MTVGPRKKDPSKNLRFELFEVPLGLKNSLVGFLGSTAHEGDYIVAAQDYRPSKRPRSSNTKYTEYRNST